MTRPDAEALANHITANDPHFKGYALIGLGERESCVVLADRRSGVTVPSIRNVRAFLDNPSNAAVLPTVTRSLLDQWAVERGTPLRR